MLIKHGSLCSVLTTVLITFFLCTLTDRVQASSSERSCIINNIIDGGTVTYIFCRDGSTDEWLMTPRISVSIGEQIFFDDAPALTNFESRHIKYTFPKIISTNVRKSVERKTSFKQVLNLAGPHESTETSRSKDDTTYVGADDNGTLVFSDDPAKVPNIHTPPVHEEDIREKVRIRGVTISEFGLYSADYVSGSFAARTNSGVVDMATNVHLLEKTSRITARIGSIIGIMYTIEGTPFNEVVDITTKVLSPTIYNPLNKKKSKVQSYVMPRALNKVAYGLYRFEQPWELVPGTWTMQIQYKGKTLASQSFQVEL